MTSRSVVGNSPLYAVIGQAEEVLVEVEGRCFISVQPHSVAGRLPQFITHRGGDERNRQAVHFLSRLSAQELLLLTTTSKITFIHWNKLKYKY